ncbi:hypothetical protein RUM44_012719 [Polyplax serrata]|uniref:Uncharacterized protein n=1 Tax=Polyplax serrata TaxID=468196 RepID=A0ABR1BE57_POLSC
MRRTECFYGRKTTIGGARLEFNESKTGDLTSLISGKASLKPSKLVEPKNAFKVPSYTGVPVRRTTVRPVISPRKRVQSGRVKNDSKLNQQSKVSFRPTASFLCMNRKSAVRNNQTKKELIKKMVYLAEFAQKESKEQKQSTPVKMVPIFTPKKTPRSAQRGFLVLPEFTKKTPNIQALRSPLKEFVKKETENWSFVKRTPSSVVKKLCKSIDETLIDISPKGNNDSTTTISNIQSAELKIESNNLLEALRKFRLHNCQVKDVLKKMQVVEHCFEKFVKQHSVYNVYEHFCQYQAQKQELNQRIKHLDNKIADSIKNEKIFGHQLKEYFKVNQELLNEQVQVLKDFDNLVETELGKLECKENAEKVENKTVVMQEKKPKLRRSLRLSKLPQKVKMEEKAPIKRKLSRLDNKPKGVQKFG